jgi:hypothetical protein
MPHFNWEKASERDDHIGYCLRDTSLDQFVSFPTHHLGNTLDLLFCNDSTLLHSLVAIASPCRSDHNVSIEFCISTGASADTPNSRVLLDFSTFDRNAAIDLLFCRDWSRCLDPHSDITESNLQFSTNIKAVQDATIQKKIVLPKRHLYPQHIRKLYADKIRLWRHRDDSALARSNYEDCSRDCENAAKNYHLQRELAACSNGPKIVSFLSFDAKSRNVHWLQHSKMTKVPFILKVRTKQSCYKLNSAMYINRRTQTPISP